MQSFQDNHQLFKVILDHEGIDFALFDEDLRLEHVCCDYEQGAVPMGTFISEFIPELGGMEHSIQSSMRSGSEISIQRLNQKRDAHNLYVDLRLIPFHEKLLVIMKDTSKYGVLEQNIIQQRNETILLNYQLEKSHRVLEELSTLDELTRLPNRRAVQKRFQSKLQYARVHQRPLSVMFLDMDNFKEINDTFGHESGDRALKLSADILRAHVRAEDAIVRWGGDEFVVILADTEFEGANRIANHLLLAFEEHAVKLDIGGKIHIHASIGICHVLPNKLESATLSDVIHTADQAMYISKANGGGQVTSLYLGA